MCLVQCWRINYIQPLHQVCNEMRKNKVRDIEKEVVSVSGEK